MGLKTEDIFCEKCHQTWLFFGENSQKSGSKFEKMAQKNLIGENGGERKINPSANPERAIMSQLIPTKFWRKEKKEEEEEVERDQKQ